MSAGFLSFLLKLFTDWSLWIHGLVSSLQEHRSHHLHSVSSVEDHSRQLKHESLHRFFCLTKLYLLFRVGWVVLHHFWVKPSRRPWPTSQQSIMTLMRSTSATPASWPRTSYAVCWSRIPSRNLPKSFFVIEQRILAHHFLTGNMWFLQEEDDNWWQSSALLDKGRGYLLYTFPNNLQKSVVNLKLSSTYLYL